MEGQLKEDRTIIIAGAGIIGCAVAYYLSKQGYKPIIVDREFEPASGASGKAGGFLARKWNDQSAVGPLTRRSYNLHKEHGKLFEDTMYRSMDTWSASVHPKGGFKEFASENLNWLDSTAVSGLSHISNEQDSAQVHPLRYTLALFAESQKMGAKFEVGKIVDISLPCDEHPELVRVQLQLDSGQSRFIEGDAVVICLGSWSGEFLQKFTNAPEIMGAIRATSVVFEPSGPVPNVALFTDWFTPGEPNHFDPEVYPRPDGSLYICACAEPVEIPPGGTLSVPVDQTITDRIEAFAAQLSPHLNEVPILSRQACLLPTTADDTPIIGCLIEDRIFVATGHSCWGILNAPATGEAMAQLIHSGKTDIDLSSFDPKRFLPENCFTEED